MDKCFFLLLSFFLWPGISVIAFQVNLLLLPKQTNKQEKMERKQTKMLCSLIFAENSSEVMLTPLQSLRECNHDNHVM